MTTQTEPTATDSFGINETRDVVRFAGRLTRAIRQTMGDGKINLKDVHWLLTVIPTIKPALDGFKQVKFEVLDLSSDEMAELSKLFAYEAEIPLTPVMQDQLQHQLQNGGGWVGMVVAMTKIGNATDADQMPITTE